ncbi:oxygen-evolving enhancer protein 3-2 [Cucumis melo var. makuwa]|uniref:16 kDa subunit of oxygen evolving system of photosystem II n=2 Tax=Cucumis melo TaxID=3656 RepID=A0A1S3B3E7_CUCME|nr:oxygen-evolving enhancer protein 3-2, chloroplastic isoform X1 [Cucumis melo]KAA0056901.1 oxygen-evolving enhancer protein 3-2 [Cucumis melo var. makuwa]TYJ99404.1 oxygen-evolving enhancer protein 3-2 [Cucumis melo var. makuwa]
MAQAMASMAGLCGSSQAVLEGSLQISGSTRLSVASSIRPSVPRSGLMIKAQQVPAEPETSRRAVLGLVAAGLASGSFVQAVLAEAKPIKVGPPPPPSGGLPGTMNSDQPRDLDLPLKDRFFLQPQSPEMAVARAKESAKDIINVKGQIEKKAWPFVRDDLRLKAEYLRYDLKTIISSKPKEEKQALKDLTGKLFQDINNLDYAAKIKSSSEAEKYYAQTVSTLNDVLSKIG